MSFTTIPSACWTALPAEMKLSIVDQLDLQDVKTFSNVSHECYQLSVPALFRVRPVLFFQLRTVGLTFHSA